MRLQVEPCPAQEQPPFGKLSAQEEMPVVGSCTQRHSGCRQVRGGHALGSRGPGSWGRQRSPGFVVGHPGRLMLGWLVAALAVLVRGGTPPAPSLACWKQCGSRWFLCSWPPHGPAGNTSYLLILCSTVPMVCRQFQAGTRTTYTLKHHQVYVLTNTTAWVEARWGDHVHRTPNLTLYLDKAVKPEPPPSEMPFKRAGGHLQLWVTVPPCHRESQPPQWEARLRTMGDSGWAQVMCKAAMEKDNPVTCALGGNGAFEVQLRYKPPHWSSYWSNWSSTIFVPEEILASPVLSYQLGTLGRDGQRVLRLGWQPAPKEQGQVTVTLRTRMLTCHCAKEDTVVLGTEVTAHNLTLSGAEYDISLTAANAAGTGPARQLRVPAEQRADLSFKDVSVAGGTVMARWEAPSPGFLYCFEQQQLLPGALNRSVCIQRDFPAKSIHVERGALETPACYRLAVHGWALAQGWATFALQHYYAGNASLGVPIRINASAGDATIILQWSPSPRATCPGVLAKYLICLAAEGESVTYAEADAAVSHHTLRNLRPGTAYRVGVREVTAENQGTCSTWWHFQTQALGPQEPVWKSHLKYLVIPLSLPAAAIIYHLIKRRARRLLFPPLPKPVGSKAIQFSAGEMSQGQPWPGFVEPLERFSPAELLLMELGPGKEMNEVGTQPGTLLPEPAAEEPPGSEKELPLTYRRQEVLSPLGSLLPGSEDEEEEEGRQGLCQPPGPIALHLFNKPIIIRDEEGWDPSLETSVLHPVPGWGSGWQEQDERGPVGC